LSGASTHACRILNKHIIALEEDKAIFDSILAPKIRVVLVGLAPTTIVIELSDDLDGEDVEIPHIVKKSYLVSESIHILHVHSEMSEYI